MHFERLEGRRLFSVATVTTLPVGNYPHLTATVGNTLYFTTSESGNNTDVRGTVWRSDRTAAGTFRIKDPESPAHDLRYTGDVLLAPLADRLLLLGVREGQSRRLWSIDNATGQATLLRTFTSSLFAHSADGAVANGILYFSVRGAADADVAGSFEEDELWRSDGTVAGTFLVKDIQPPVTNFNFFNSDITEITAAGSRVFFTGSTQDNGAELFVSDGTPVGTRMVIDLRTGVDTAGLGLGSFPHRITPLGNGVVFTTFVGDTSNDGLRVWFSDGTAKGTTLLFDGDMVGNVSLVRERGLVFFEGTDHTSNTMLWRTDGTKTGTFPVYNRSVTDQQVFEGRLFFDASEGHFVTDGTIAGTRIEPPPFEVGYGLATWPQPIGDTGVHVFNAAFAGQTSPFALWRTDGTAAGTLPLTDYGAAGGVTPAESIAYFYNGAGGDAPPVLSVYDPNAGNIAGTVYDDVNADGARQNGEAPLRGYKVFIDRNGDGICNTKEPFTRASSTGRFRFDGLPAGAYTIRVVGVEGRRASTPERYRVRVTPDGTYVRYFGRTEQALVAGIVYMDANKNGTIDGAEAGMAGWTVFIDRNRDGLLDAIDQQTVTDELGRFIFSNVDPGSHQIRVVPQSRYRLTAPGAGYRAVTMSAGGVYGKANFGEKRITTAG